MPGDPGSRDAARTAGGPAAPDQRNAPALVAKDISYSYGDVLAVDNLSLEVAHGEILGLLGPNGAGKSTTIRMLTGQLRPRTGTISILDAELTGDPGAIQRWIGVCFEDKNLYPSLTGRENLRFFGRLFGIHDLGVDGLLERVGLRERGADRVSNYSKGMRQRLMIARTLVNDPAVLFLDEPTDGLDPVSARTIRALVRAEAARGAAVLLTTHDMYEADELSDRVAFIDRGRILAMGSPSELKLAHGRRSIRIRLRVADTVEERVIPLDEANAAAQLQDVVASGDVLTIHTEEATLEDVFVEFAGRGLT